MKNKHNQKEEKAQKETGEEEEEDNKKQDFYTTLNLPKDASPSDIRNAYKALVRRWHPDKNPPSLREEAEAKFKAITQAYEALNDKDNQNMFGLQQGSKREDPSSTSSFSTSSSSSGSYSRHRSADSLLHSANRRPTTSNATSSFSYTILRKKPPPIEKRLDCSLEELCFGCVKKIMITRDVVSTNGASHFLTSVPTKALSGQLISAIVKEQELLRIKVKPGWKKGTKITFEGMGDEKPGSLPADIIFSIAEKHHPLFKREGNDLVLAVEIPLVKALTGCTLSIPLLGGEKTNCIFDEVIHPGYEKVIHGQGMPNAREKGGRGDLHIKFRISFPTKLSEEQRSGIVELLQSS
ncbi:hypothetical protein QJS10_CPA02g00530 [Acorus calamus]|uniref:J domain-containing protein n=1 Tax=Acorus calamus TaxID=4465 RepID=A0AAV9FDJ0_ACOCL|nr:hypothetical protein QJS10_CPA02g00530 [Acorus calamus]